MSNKKIYKLCKCIDDEFSTDKLKINCKYFYDPENIFIDTDKDEYLEIYSNSSNPKFFGWYLAKHFKKM